MELKLILLLPAAALLVELGVQSDSTAGVPKARSNVRLCGESLKRAIIYSCGGSRWKREEMDPPLPAQSDQTGSNKVLENTKLQSSSDPEPKQPQGDGPLDKEPSWSDFYEYYNDEKKNIPTVKEDPTWYTADLENDPELNQVQHDHPPDTEPSWTDFLDVYNDNKEYTAAGAESGRQESPDENRLGNPDGSDFPQAKVKRKRETSNFQLEMAIKCCSVGCTAQDIAAFC